MLKTPTIQLQSMQAESMIQAARQYAEARGKSAVKQAKQHFEDTALAFFKTTNNAYVEKVPVKNGSGVEFVERLKFKHNPKKPNFITNAIIAFSTELRKAEEECSTIVRKPSKSFWDKIFTDGQSVRGFVIEQMENTRINNPELDKQISRFETIMSVLHPKASEQRLNIAHSGLVRADGVYKPTTMDKIIVNLNRFRNLFN